MATARDELDRLLIRRSGLLGLTGRSDMRDVETAADDGHEDAALALGVWAHQIRHYVGAYLAQLGGLDALVFTAGIGENSPVMRARALAGLEHLGLPVDADRNALSWREPREISPEGAAVRVLVVPTNEELAIARAAAALAECRGVWRRPARVPDGNTNDGASFSRWLAPERTARR